MQLNSEFLKNGFTNFLGWKTNRKILVIESDDWGTNRMPSKKVFDILDKKGFKLDSHYNRLDSLETGKDLEMLFEVLNSIKNSNNVSPVMTANYLVANPDFDKIREHNFENYFYETLTESSVKNPSVKESMEVMRSGIANTLFFPQFHGREHLNFRTWMHALRANHEQTKVGFDYGFFSLKTDSEFSKRGHYLTALDLYSSKDLIEVEDALTDGINIFETIFGYRPKSFIAPNYVWHKDIEKSLKSAGVDFIQGQRNQVSPVLDNNNYKSIFHYTGQSNIHNQKYIVRNVHFEPSSDESIDWVNQCLKNISEAFFLKTPCILSTHRVNFIGTISPENRGNNLKKFTLLLQEIIKRWPQVEFLSTVQLGELIQNKK